MSKDKMKLKGWVEIHNEKGELEYSSRNTIEPGFLTVFTNWLCADDDEIPPRPSYIAAGYSYEYITPLDEMTSLVSEAWREGIINRTPQSGAGARLVATIPTGEGVGEWREIGLFDETHYKITISTCDSTTGWTSNNALTPDADIFRQGTSSLTSIGAGTISFRNDALMVDAALADLSNSFLQLWYYIDDKSLLTSNITIAVSSSVNDNTDEYAWTIDPTDLIDGWNFLNLDFLAATQTGIFNPANIRRFKLHATKSTTVIEHLDGVRLFSKAGILMARAELDPPVLKGAGEQKSISWIIGVS